MKQRVRREEKRDRDMKKDIERDRGVKQREIEGE